MSSSSEEESSSAAADELATFDAAAGAGAGAFPLNFAGLCDALGVVSTARVEDVGFDSGAASGFSAPIKGAAGAIAGTCEGTSGADADTDAAASSSVGTTSGTNDCDDSPSALHLPQPPEL